MGLSDFDSNQIDDLIRRAYQIVGEPERLVELQHAIEAGSRFFQEGDASLNAHFEQANRLMELIPASEEDDFSRFGMDGHLTPYSPEAGVLFRLDENLRIVAVDDPDHVNAELKPGDDMMDWVASESEAMVGELRKLATGRGAMRALVLRFYTELGDDRGNLGLAVRAKAKDNAAILIRQIGLKWSVKDERAFAAAFNLTNAEIQLVRCLVEAKGVNGFASERGSKVSTARTQLKRLQKKLAVSTQGEIISLYAGFVGLLSRDYTAPIGANIGAEPCGEMCVEEEVIRFQRYGRAKGRPILILHGALEGPFLPRRVIDEIIRQDLNAIIPWMPFYSGSYSDFTAKERMIAFAKLLPDFLDQLGIDQCPVIACSLSTGYAFAAVKEHPERYTGVVLAGMALPLTETLDKQAMNPAWRAPLELGARFPRFFELFSRTIFRLAMRGEVQYYFDRLFKDSPLDLKTLREPDIANTMRLAAERRTDRFGAAMAHGLVVMTLDWSEWLSAVSCL